MTRKRKGSALALPFTVIQVSRGVRRREAPTLPQPIAAAFTSASMNGTYWAKLSANMFTNFLACAS